jgi:hypothetical protein
LLQSVATIASNPLVYKDIKQVRGYYAALREAVILNNGGRDDAKTRARIEELCAAGTSALDDQECHERLRAVREHAGELFSASGHLKWARKNMTGADYLRLQILIALEALNTRLFFIQALRDRVMAGAMRRPQPSGAG